MGNAGSIDREMARSNKKQSNEIAGNLCAFDEIHFAWC